MNQLKKWAGIVWILLGPVAIYYLIKTALHQTAEHPSLDTSIQWGVFVVVFIPIAIGLMIFGYYAWKDEYKKE
ncbi:MAG TPA: hypothetical protein VJ552_10180 [Sediminibacterium sp.]|nr:hypothetical protein [Sediminibacterium sp.]